MKRLHLLFIAAVLSCAPLSAATEPAVFGDFRGRTATLSVRSLVQQDNGMIWFGTDRVLYSFDGYDLRPYACPDGHINTNKLLCLDDRLLLGTNDGLYAFCPQDKTYHRTAPFDKQIVRELLLFDGTVYIGTEVGLYRYDPEVDTATRLLEGNIFSLSPQADTLYVGTQRGVAVYHPGSGTITTLTRPDGPNIIIALLPDGNRLWAGTPNRLLCLDIRSGEVLSESSFLVPKVLHKEKDGRLLVGTDNGLYRFDPAGGGQTRLRSSVTWVCAEDREKNLWFGTEDGLLLLQQHPTVQPIPGLPEEKNAHYTDLLRDRQGRLWLSGSNGIVLMEDGVAMRHYTMTNPEYRIPHNRIRRIVEDRENGELYFASDGGILKYDMQNGRMQQIRISDSYNWVYDLLPRPGELWAASFQGLYRLGPDGSTLDLYDQGDGLSSDDIARIVGGRDGGIWILTRDQHVFRLDPGTKEIRKIDVGASRPDDICYDREGRIWIIAGNQILRLTPDGEGTENIRSQTLHPNDNTEAFCLTDADSQIWACTSQGLFSIEKETLGIHSTDTYRHYFGIEYDASRRCLLLGSVGSVDILHLDELVRASAESRQAPIAITGILVNGTRRIEPEELGERRLLLPNRQNHLDISFSDFNFNDETPHRFDYRLDGSRTTRWRGSIVGNMITLTGLQPGRYQLSVAPSGSMENATELLSFRIRPPWPFAWWMILLYSLLFVSAILAFIRQAMMRRNLMLERRQRDDLLAQSKQKEAFFQDVAHEFKTPLSLIIGPLGKMISEAGPDTDLKSLRLAQDNATKLSSLIHHMINYYKDTGGMADSLISTEVEMVDFARSIFDSYRENFPKHEFIFTSSHPEIPVVVDIVKVETILNNLLSNACKYTPAGGSVLMTLERDDAGHQLVIKVSDTGIGIPEEELPFAFQRYFESSRTKQGGYDSTGIGLSVIKSYVEIHGGRVSVSSDANGSTFTVLLPCLSDRTSLAPKKAPDAADDPDKPLIAIVDDNAQICNFLESILRENYRCVCSHNGKSGLKLCKDVLPDLVISDVLMPVMDGLEMCRQVRQYGPLSTIPIILLTAKDDKQTEQESIGLNIDVFLPKPFEVETLTARVDQLLANKKRMEQKLRMEMLATPAATRELSQDERFLRKVTQLIEEHLDDADLSVSRLCELGEFSEKQLYRKLKQFTGQSAVEYIRSIRLKKAALLLQSGNFTVSEVMYSVGFSNASYFTRTFSAAYNMTPSDYMKSFKTKSL
ncbi:MAG: response regulator [Bacteroidales bacterium]|nr:response regulator [Bacteroidales bacterium]